MSYPLLPKKHEWSSLVSIEQLVKPQDKNLLPTRVIICFFDHAAHSLRKISSFEKTVSSPKTRYTIDLYKKKKDTGEICVGVVSNFGIGAPASVLCLEQLRVLGVKEFISIGMVGSLNADLEIGKKVIIKKAFRDEGCSYHYKAASPYIELSDKSKFFEKMNLRSVSSWTTDAPCRETKEEVLYFQSQGVECVEMESSALMAAGEYYGLSVYCTGVVSDHLSAEGWTPRFSHPAVKKSLYELLNQVLFL